MKNNRSHTLALVVVLVILAGAIAAYVYMHSAVNFQAAEALKLRDQVATEETARGQGKNVSAIFENTAAARTKVSNLFVPTNDIVLLIVAVESVGPESGGAIDLASIDVEPAAAGYPGSGSVIIKGTVQGSWLTVVKALRLLENLPYASRLDRISLNVSISSNAQAKRNWTLSFSLRAATADPIATSTPQTSK